MCHSQAHERSNTPPQSVTPFSPHRLGCSNISKEKALRTSSSLSAVPTLFLYGLLFCVWASRLLIFVSPPVKWELKSSNCAVQEKFCLIASNLRSLSFAVFHKVISELLDTSQNKISTSWTFLGLLRPTFFQIIFKYLQTLPNWPEHVQITCFKMT